MTDSKLKSCALGTAMLSFSLRLSFSKFCKWPELKLCDYKFYVRETTFCLQPWNHVYTINLKPDILHLMDTEIISTIKEQHIRLTSDADTPCWNLNSSGCISITSAWQLCRTKYGLLNSSRYIWHKDLASHISVFMRRLWLQKLPIDEGLLRKGFNLVFPNVLVVQMAI